MLEIAIYDDELIFAKDLKLLLETSFANLKIGINCSILSNENELISSVLENTYEVIFLDIELKNSNGVDVAKELRIKNYKGTIIFVTSHSEFLPEGYKVEAFRYIIKQNMERELNECISALLRKLNLIKIKIDNLDIDLNEIVYIESYNHKLTFHLISGDKLECWKKLSYIEEVINSDQLVRVHQSYIINMRYFKRIIKYKVILIGDIEIPVPRKKYNIVNSKITIRRSLWD
ncbi:MAG: LytR/AlgR family response regulator transcription factor [Filifactoraceae bacterium]